MKLKKQIISFEKINKLQKIQLNDERRRLQIIRENLEKVDAELKTIQDQYWQNIDAINQEKMSGNISHVEAGQSSSNFYREKFIEVMSFRKKIEAEFEKQQHVVTDLYKQSTLTVKAIDKKKVELKQMILEEEMNDLQERSMRNHYRQRT